MVYRGDHQAHGGYELISQANNTEGEKTTNFGERTRFNGCTPFSHVRGLLVIVVMVITGVSGFALGILTANLRSRNSFGESVAPRIHLPTIQRFFTFPSPFSQPPPGGLESGNVSEPIWDALIPSMLFDRSSLVSYNQLTGWL
jgi:hypothetical protein